MELFFRRKITFLLFCKEREKKISEYYARDFNKSLGSKEVSVIWQQTTVTGQHRERLNAEGTSTSRKTRLSKESVSGKIEKEVLSIYIAPRLSKKLSKSVEVYGLLFDSSKCVSNSYIFFFLSTFYCLNFISKASNKVDDKLLSFYCNEYVVSCVFNRDKNYWNAFWDLLYNFYLTLKEKKALTLHRGRHTNKLKRRLYMDVL